jgi:nicotinate-nucleotide adenylyltransferase
MEKSEIIKRDLYAQEPRRIKHIEGVYECAMMLRDRHAGSIPDEYIAEAAYMHDFTKEYSDEKQLELLSGYGIEPDGEGTATKLFHAKTAAAMAKAVYALPDEVCDAILYHTTGRANMTDLEKIIYLADYIEKNRTFIDCVDVRDTYLMLYEKGDPDALDRAIFYSLDLTLEDLLKKSFYIHPDTVSARNWLFLKFYRKDHIND